MKHVLVLNQFAVPRSQSGGTRHVDLFSRVDGWAPTLVAGHRNYGTQEAYVTEDHRFRLVRIPAYTSAGLVRVAGWALFAIQATWVGVRQRQLDAVYASTPHLLSPVAGWAVSRVRRVPLVVEVRDLWPESIVGADALRRDSGLHRVLVRLERWIYQSADHIVAVTEGWESHFASLGVPADKVTVISNGTDIDDFSVDDDRTTLREDFGFHRLTAVYAGTHGPSNALHLLLDAARENPDVDVVLVGSGSEKVGLQKKAESLPNVFFRDPVPKSELARLLVAADVGVHCIEPLPVLKSGMSPNKLFDYMAAGLPTISNAGEGLRAVVSDGEAGHTGGPDDLGENLQRVAAASEERRRAWGRTGRSIVSERFSRDVAADRLGRILDHVVTHIRRAP
ncbi:MULTISPECIES: glycosyltransferase family 4 protein [unclassified Knoellia]|uniref:glycosyltransferase family 4 protein n=1 Tax=Knoellia altitudinis TaxID=3404795 RepID=UPI0036066001